MKSKFFILVAFAVFLSSCADEIIEPELPPTRSFRNLTFKDVPNVVNKLQEGLGLRGGNKRLSVNEGDRTYGVIIDWERITELIDTVGNTNYTFAVIDEDENPYTFHNLIIGKNEQGYWKRPYLLTYIMGDEFKAQYDATGSTDGFTGRVLKRYINSGLSTQRGVSNDDYYGDPYAGSGDPCNRETTIINPGNNTSGGGNPDNEYIPEPDLDYEVCYGIWEDSEVESCSSGANDYCTIIRPPILVIVCEELAMSAADDAYGNCNDDLEEVAILEPEIDLEALEELLELLEENPELLLDIPCSEIEKWIKVAEHKVSQEVTDRLQMLNGINSSTFNFQIQPLEGMGGPTVNMDFFSVTVTELPNGMTGDGFLDHIRKNINNFVNTGLSEFKPYNHHSLTNESALWNSPNPTGALISIDIPNDNATVVCSEYTNRSWKFSTVTSPNDWKHPVSGTREFGYNQNSDGTYTFYTRGVDRLTYPKIPSKLGASAVVNFMYNFTERQALAGADRLWESFQNGIESYVNSNGGYAFKNGPQIHRPDYDLLEQVLLGNLPINALGCD